MPRMTFAALAITALTVLPLAALPVDAVAPTVQLVGVLEMPIPVAHLQVVADPDPGDTGAVTSLAGPHCSADSFSLDEARRAFTFREGEQEGGCLGVRFDVTLPAGTRDMELRFKASRTVRQQASLADQPEMVQAVRLLIDGRIESQSPVFDPSELSRNSSQPMPFPFQVRAGVTRVQIEWYFADMGRLATREGPGRMEAFSATVWEPALHFDRIQLPDPVVSQGAGGLVEGEYEAQYSVEAIVPTAFLSAAAAGQFSMQLEMDATYRLVGVDGPNGRPLPVGQVSGTLEGGSWTVTLLPETLRAHGAGPYTVQLSIPEPLREHGTFQFLSYVVLGAPALAIAAAWFGLRRTEIDTGLEQER